MTVRDLITGAMRLIGVIAAGEQAQADEAQDALSALNDMIDSWMLERLMVYAILPERFPTVAGKAAYTMGPGGDFNTNRPVRIDKVNLIYTQTTPLPLTLNVELIDLDQYQAFIVPGTSSPIPMWVYADDNYPLRTLYFYTVPSLVEQIEIFSWTAINAFSDINQTVNLPKGYARALRYNLAAELAPEYGKQISATVAAIAVQSKGAIKSANEEPLLMQVDQALTSRRTGFNYLTGE